jgi:hypothetical protein
MPFRSLGACLALVSLSLFGCESRKCFERECLNALQLTVRHPDGVIPQGHFELTLELDGITYRCEHEVEGSFVEPMPCAAQGSGPDADAGDLDAGLSGPLDADAGSATTMVTLQFGLDTTCANHETGSGSQTDCAVLQTSSERVTVQTSRTTPAPRSVALWARFSDGLQASETIQPEYDDIAFNGVGCPGVCQLGEATWLAE